MIKITISGDFKNFEKAINNLIQDTENLDDVMIDVGIYLMRVVDLNFQAQGRPTKWQATSRGGQILADTGRLRRSLTVKGNENIFESGKNFVTVGSSVPYAAVHQFGATITAKNKPYLVFNVNGRWYKVKQVVIPARPFLVVGEKDLDICKEILKDRLLKRA